ncbi:endonuclease, partial [Pseudarthrobacter sp. CCNWLW217]
TLQGPAETRTMTQLRADIAAQLLLSGGFPTGSPAEARTDTAAGNSAGTSSVSVNSGGARSTSDGTKTSTGFSDGTAPSSSDVVAGGVPAADSATASDVMTGRVPLPAAQVLVTVPVFALMGLTDEPATLDGYGPIPASMARNLVADGAGSFHRVLTDPRNGAPLEIGRQSYRIPAAMRQWLRLRDGKCPFPGCNNQSLDNEADHLLAWADGGTTGISNLGQPCPKHHRLKHTTAWTPTEASIDKPPGWTSPTGRHYQSEHQDWEPPQWPPRIMDELARHEPDPSPVDGRLPGDALPDDALRL